MSQRPAAHPKKTTISQHSNANGAQILAGNAPKLWQPAWLDDILNGVQPPRLNPFQFRHAIASVEKFPAQRMFPGFTSKCSTTTPGKARKAAFNCNAKGFKLS